MAKSKAQRNREHSGPPATRNIPATSSPERTSAVRGVTAWIQARLLRIPRILRIVLVFFLAVAVSGVIFPLVDEIYIQYFFTPDTRIIPSYVTTSIGLLFYLFGWYLVVGPSGANRVSAHPVMVLYLLAGIAALCLDIVLIIQGFSMTDAISG